MPPILNSKLPPGQPPTAQKPKLVNRGGAGLLAKIPKNKDQVIDHGSSSGDQNGSQKPTVSVPEIPDAPINKIASSLKSLLVDIVSLTPDPNNARTHPERNMISIMQSLQMYGQVKPIVVRRDKMIIVAGNGTYEAATRLAWTQIAASIVDMTDVEAAGYGLADNRSAELAKWDFEVVARLDQLLLEAGHASIGWSLDELEVLRAADWQPPPIIDDGDGTSSEPEPLLISFKPDDYTEVGQAINAMRVLAGDSNMSQADALLQICRNWLASHSEVE